MTRARGKRTVACIKSKVSELSNGQNAKKAFLTLQNVATSKNIEPENSNLWSPDFEEPVHPLNDRDSRRGGGGVGPTPSLPRPLLPRFRKQRTRLARRQLPSAEAPVGMARESGGGRGHSSPARGKEPRLFLAGPAGAGCLPTPEPLLPIEPLRTRQGQWGMGGPGTG